MISNVDQPREQHLTVNGANYHLRIAGEGPPLLLLHGFTGSGADWMPITGLGRHFRAIAVDLLGHGASDAPVEPTRYRLEAAVADLTALLDQVLYPLEDGSRERFGLLGYSMGGRLALALALALPDRVAALVLESASPGLLDPEERAARVRSDEALAEYAERAGVAAFTRRWEATPLFASQQRLPVPVRAHLREARLRNRPKGLANSLRGMGAGVHAPMHERLGELRMPTLLIVGALDTKYSALAEEMAATIPRAQVAIIPDAGHTVHLEQPRAFEERLLAFFRNADGADETDNADSAGGKDNVASLD